ncbi:hypothetical protein D2T29_00535 [Sinirhodobacter populi]|uniref:Phage major capsid protein n=1 Tax=Paenirhodobacter populi TaxID=2306993 RepID=A0A443KQA5_9RHOB|nr:phage capsid protein [Sinirhodobacter populi]RWR34998.1 hypothetical protein D2T29_00535 [Sinirhodobacter populi]
MSLEVTQHHKLQYASNVMMVAQQTRNALQGAVTTVPATGEAQSVADLFDAVEAQRGDEKSRRNVETPVSGSRRWVVLQPSIEAGGYITKEEKFRTATDPTSHYVRNYTMAVNRGCGDLALGVSKQKDGNFRITDGGILGIAREGKTPGTGTELPASQYIDNGGLGMVLDKLIAAQEKLRLADFGLEDEFDQLFCAISPKQITNLLNIAAQTQVNLNAFEIQQIKSGKPTTLLGVTWIFTNRLPFKKGTTDIRLNPIWAKSNIVYAEWQGVQGQMWNDTSAKNLPYALVDTYADCVRAQDNGVVVIESKEAA